MLFYEENPNMYNIIQVIWILRELMESELMNFNPLKALRFLIMVFFMIILLPGCQIIKQGETPLPAQNSLLPESMLDPSSESNSTPLILSDISLVFCCPGKRRHSFLSAAASGTQPAPR